MKKLEKKVPDEQDEAPASIVQRLREREELERECYQQQQRVDSADFNRTQLEGYLRKYGPGVRGEREEQAAEAKRDHEREKAILETLKSKLAECPLYQVVAKEEAVRGLTKEHLLETMEGKYAVWHEAQKENRSSQGSPPWTQFVKETLEEECPGVSRWKEFGKTKKSVHGRFADILRMRIFRSQQNH